MDAFLTVSAAQIGQVKNLRPACACVAHAIVLVHCYGRLLAILALIIKGMHALATLSLHACATATLSSWSIQNPLVSF